MPSLTDLVSNCEREILKEALRLHDGDVDAVCEALQVPRRTLYHRLERLELKPEDYRETVDGSTGSL